MYSFVCGFFPIAFSLWCVPGVHSLLLSKSLSYGHSLVYLFIDLFLDIWVVSSIWLLWMKPLGTLVYRLMVSQCRRHQFYPWAAKSPWSGEYWSGKWPPTPNSCLENSMGSRVWQATVHGVAKGQTWQSTQVHGYVMASQVNTLHNSVVQILFSSTAPTFIDIIKSLQCAGLAEFCPAGYTRKSA